MSVRITMAIIIMIIYIILILPFIGSFFDFDFRLFLFYFNLDFLLLRRAALFPHETHPILRQEAPDLRRNGKDLAAALWLDLDAGDHATDPEEGTDTV